MHWCGGSKDLDTNAIADDLAVFGLSPDAFSNATDNVEHFEVLEENWDTILVFLACQTQWRREVPGMATEWIWHGLRYDGCECVIRNMGFKGKKAREIFLDLQVMEIAALPHLNKPK